MSFFDDASLAFLPSGAAGKDGKAYSIKPKDGTGDFTFSRGSNLAATRVGPTGLIEKGRENLLLRSNEFDIVWGLGTGTITSGESGYDGTNDAWLLDSAANYLYQSISVTGVHTFSVYAKKATANEMRLRIRQTADANAYFDLVNGVVLTPSGEIKASITDVSNGWYRCEVAFVASGTTTARIYSNDGDSIYIQDAQLEIGLAATEVISTGATTGKAGLLEDEPRFDYSGGATCPSLLLEPSRTNLFTQSEYFDSWLPTNASVSNNTSISPEGLQNASTLTGSSFGRIYQIISYTAGDYTFSVFVKKTSTSQEFSASFIGNADDTFTIDLSDGTNTYKGVNVSTAYAVSYGDWWRVIATSTRGNETNTQARIYVGYPTPIDPIIWGAQLEVGSYPTSYIPNHSGGSVTRGADRADLTKAVVSEGSLFISVGGTTQPQLSVLGEFFNASTTSNKVAIAYSSTILKVSHNGSIVVDKTGTFDVSSLTEIDLGHDNGADQADAPIKQFLTFDELLTNADLNALTI